MSDLVPEFPLASAAMARCAPRRKRGTRRFFAALVRQNPSGCREIPAGELTRSLI